MQWNCQDKCVQALVNVPPSQDSERKLEYREWLGTPGFRQGGVGNFVTAELGNDDGDGNVDDELDTIIAREVNEC